MASTQFPSAGQILAGLTADPDAPLNSTEFNRVKDYVVLLPEVATQAGLTMDQPLDLIAMLTLQNAFTRAAIDRGMEMGFLGGAAALSAISQQEIMMPDLPGLIESGQLDPHGIMLGDRVGLNPSLQELYRAGRLTVGYAIEHQPRIFMTK